MIHLLKQLALMARFVNMLRLLACAYIVATLAARGGEAAPSREHACFANHITH